MNKEDCLKYSALGGAAERFLDSPGIREMLEGRVKTYEVALCSLPASSPLQAWAAAKGALVGVQWLLSELESLVEISKEAEQRIQNEDFSEAQLPTLL